MVRRPGFADLVDDLAEAAGREMREVLVDVVKKARQPGPARAAEAPQYLSVYVCASCRNPFTPRDFKKVAMIHPTQPFCFCNTCFNFFWEAGLRMKEYQQRRQGIGGGPAGPPEGAPAPPPPTAKKSPWKIVGVEMDAPTETIKKAYRLKAATMHPDLFVGKSSDEQLAAKEAFHELQTAYEVLMKIRKVAV